jgi:hypothetical protein
MQPLGQSLKALVFAYIILIIITHYSATRIKGLFGSKRGSDCWLQWEVVGTRNTQFGGFMIKKPP